MKPEKQLKPLSGRGKSISTQVTSEGKEVLWGKLKFYLPDSIIENIMQNYFSESDRWYPLGASVDNPIKGGLGEFIRDSYKNFSPRHACAIAAIMVNDELLAFRGKKPIELKKIGK